MNTVENINSTYPLTSGTKIPVLGFGTWNLDEGKETQSVAWALEAGYRHIDTAAVYGTEDNVGEAVKESDIPRDNLFITTKLWNQDQGYETTLEAIDTSLEKLGMDYVDLYLIHWPFTKETEGENRREETWRAMEEIYESGKAKAIGVSNYTQEHLEEMEEYANIPPAVNQIEFHPFWFRKDLMEYCHDNDIVLIDYSPLTRSEWLKNEVIEGIAEHHNKTPAQVLLRWGLQHSNAVIPKSSTKEHIEENTDIFDFSLSQEDMTALNNLNENKSVMGTEF